MYLNICGIDTKDGRVCHFYAFFGVDMPLQTTTTTTTKPLSPKQVGVG